MSISSWSTTPNLIVNLVVNYFFLRCNMLKPDQWNVPVATLSVSPAGCHSRIFHQVTCLYFEYPCACSHQDPDDMIVFSENWHDPVRCHLIKKWIKKCDDDRCVTFERGPNWPLIAQTRKELSNFCMRQCCTDQKKSVLAACRLYNRCANLFKCVARQAIGSLPTPRSAQRYVTHVMTS